MEIKTFNCQYSPEDSIEVWADSHGILLKTTVEEDDGEVKQLAVVLSVEDVIEMGKMAQRYTTKPSKPVGYRGLSPLAQTIVQHMRRAGSISAREAMADHGITSASLARRICDIEEAGFGIKRERRKHPVTGQPYTRYSITEDISYAA